MPIRSARGDLEVIGRDADAHAAPQFDDVAKALGGQHPGFDAGAGQQRVGGDGGAMNDGVDIGQQRIETAAAGIGSFPEAIHHAFGQAPVGGRRLVHLHGTVRCGDHHVGKRATDIDADAQQAGPPRRILQVRPARGAAAAPLRSTEYGSTEPPRPPAFLPVASVRERAGQEREGE
jgi:hypothetical protein